MNVENVIDMKKKVKELPIVSRPVAKPEDVKIIADTKPKPKS